MEEFNDLYQNKINEAMAKLPKESVEAISNINWRLIILGMKNYTADQLEALEIETELLLYGITNGEDYPYELQKRMSLTKEDTEFLVGEMNRLVFQKIEDELKMILERKRKFEIKQNFLDPRFSTLPLRVQKAIAKSNWRSNLYEISQKYKFNVEEIGILEKITVRVIKNEIDGDKFLDEILTNIRKPKEEIKELVKDINEKIIIEIREILKKEQEETDGKKEVVDVIQTSSFEKIPLPPYSRVKSDKGETLKPLRLNNDNFKTNNKNLENKSIDEDLAPRPWKKDEPIEKNINSQDIIKEKLKDIAINNSNKSSNNGLNTNRGRQSDPYREPF